jgi:hypothetical protein
MHKVLAHIRDCQDVFQCLPEVEGLGDAHPGQQARSRAQGLGVDMLVLGLKSVEGHKSVEKVWRGAGAG